jgi:ribonuclease P protein component
LGGRGRRISEIKASLVYRVSSRTARAIPRNLVKKQTNKQTNKQEQVRKCLSLVTIMETEAKNIKIRAWDQVFPALGLPPLQLL